MAARSHASLVVQELRVASTVLIGESQCDLRHVRRCGDAVIYLIGAVPGPVAANDQTLHDYPRFTLVRCPGCYSTVLEASLFPWRTATAFSPPASPPLSPKTATQGVVGLWAQRKKPVWNGIR